MRLHRFYVAPDQLELKHIIWINDERIINQWKRVLRFRAGQEVVLFDGVASERSFGIVNIR